MSKYSLLVVDDDEELLDTFATWFARRGFRVTTAHHPRMAVAVAAYNHVDAALIDSTLPEMNGLELIDSLRGINDLPVIFLAGDHDPRLRSAAMERGAKRFLLKPVSMRTIEEAVRESIEDSQITPSRKSATRPESVS